MKLTERPSMAEYPRLRIHLTGRCLGLPELGLCLGGLIIGTVVTLQQVTFHQLASLMRSQVS